MGPAEAIDDKAVIRLQFDGLAHHFKRFGQIEALLDHRITEIVQDQRLIGLERQRLAEISFGLLPLLGALIGDAAIVEDRPFERSGAFTSAMALAIDLSRLGELLIGAMRYCRA